MKNLACAALVLNALGICAAGQSTKGSRNIQTTVLGCLSHSDTGYMLTDTSGTTYQLMGDLAQLSNYVGHDIQISGTTALAGEAPGLPSAATREMTSQIDVSGVKHISSTCNSKSESLRERPPQQ